MLPYIQSPSRELSQLQTTWASQLNPLLQLPLNQAIVLSGINLTLGANVINHLLGRKLVGWVIVRLRASATFYDTQDTNQSPALTLELVASAPAVVDIIVF